VSDLWLPPGARRFDDEVERVIESSDDPAELRAAAEGLAAHGFKFPSDGLAGTVQRDSAVLLFASRWFRFENERGEWPLAAMVKSAEIERMLLDGNLHYENGMVADTAENEVLQALCPALVVRLAEFQTFTPLAYEHRDGAARAPDDWAETIQADGFALAIEQDEERFLYFSTGPCHPANGLVLPAREGKVGRNEPCPCGSGIKHKRCCGR
jgi:hypothetical protein